MSEMSENKNPTLSVAEQMAREIKQSPLSVYIGRIVNLPDGYRENGMIYVDINTLDGDIKSPKTKKDSSDDWNEKMNLEMEGFGYRKAVLSRTLLSAVNLWENPPTNYYKGSLTGMGSITISNYMFDPLTMTWISTVSTALNAIGVVNIPPIFVSLSETGVPVPQTNVDVGQLVEDSFSNAINSMTDLMSPGGQNSVLPTIDVQDLLSGIKDSLGGMLEKSLSSALGSGLGMESLYGSLSSALGSGLGMESLYGSVNGVGSMLSMLTSQTSRITELLPSLKDMYGYQELLNKRDVLKESLTPKEGEIVKKIESLEASAKDQLAALKGQVTGAVTQQVQKIKAEIMKVIMGIVSPITQKLVNLYNDAIENIRSQIKSVIDKHLAPPLRKVKKKLVRIVTEVITPVIQKLPGPARLAASLAIKPVLSKLIEKLVGFITDKVKEKIRSLFDKGKDKLVEMLISEMSGMFPNVMESFKEDFSIRSLSKMEWLMSTEVGEKIKALSDTVKDMVSDLDAFHSEVNDLLIPSNSLQEECQSMLSELLTSFYLGMYAYTEGKNGRLVSTVGYYDPVRGYAYTSRDGTGKWTGLFANTESRFGSLPVYTVLYNLYSKDRYNMKDLVDKFMEHLSVPLLKLNAYGEALMKSPEDPSTAVTKTLENLPETLMLSTSQRDIVEGSILKVLESAVKGTVSVVQRVDENTFTFLCDLLGIASDILWDTNGQPYITNDNPLFPSVVSKGYEKVSTNPHTDSTRSVAMVQITWLDGSVSKYPLEYWTYCSALVRYAISDLLTSVYELVNGGPKYSQPEYGKFQSLQLTAQDGIAFHTYAQNSSDDENMKRRKASAYVFSDPQTGMMLEIRVASYLNVMDYNQYKSKKKTYMEVRNSGSFTVQFLPFNLINDEYFTYLSNSGKLDDTKDYYTVNKAQARVLTGWGMYRYVVTGEDYLRVVEIELEDTPEDGQTWKYASTNGLKFSMKRSDGTVKVFTKYELESFNILPSEVVDFSKCNGYFMAKDLRYLCAVPIPSTGNTIYYDAVLPTSKDKNGNADGVFYWNTYLQAETDDDGDIILNEDGTEVLHEVTEPVFVELRSIIPYAGSVVWKDSDNDAEVDMSAFCFVQRAEWEGATHFCDVMLIKEEDNHKLAANVQKIDTSYSKNTTIHRSACKELVSYTSYKKGADALINGTVRSDRYPVRGSVREKVDLVWEGKTEKYHSLQEIISESEKIVQSTLDKCKDAMHESFDAVDWVTVNLEEPLRSDTVQKTMDRLVSYMEDTATDVSEYGEAFSDTMKNIMSKMGDAASKVVDLDKLMNRVKDMLGGLSAVSDVIKTLSSLGDAANKINDTFDSLAGGLDASLSSALSSAIGPSMSLSASMGEYDVSLTEKPHSQMPWKYDLDSDTFLKVGDIVLLLAIGNSTDKLYVVDVPANTL